MNNTYKPNGYTSVAPYLIINGAGRTIEFLKEAFDATELRRSDTPEGKIMHAEVRIDDTVLMLADAAEGWPPQPTHIHVYVPDVDVAYQRALAAGAESVQTPMKKDDPDKHGGVKDASGTTWWLATQVG